VNNIGIRSFRFVAILIGAYFVGLLAFGEPAFAHAPNVPSLELTAVDVDFEMDHGTHEQEDHCHGNGYCGGSVMIPPALAGIPIPVQATRYGIPGATKVFPAVSSFDPPPP
jgi:hypothetical protein